MASLQDTCRDETKTGRVEGETTLTEVGFEFKW